MSKTADDSEKVRWWYLGLMILLVLIPWSLFLMEWFPWWITNERGQFGDSFGAVNALFAGLAFAGVIFAIFLQSKELRLQRQELGLQRQELKDTRAEIKGQKETLQKQNFESSFFQLLGLQNDIVNSMEIQQGYSGRAGFSPLFQDLKSKYETAKHNAQNDTSKTEANILNDAFETIFCENRSHVDHYLRHLHHIVKFVDGQRDFPKERIEKKRYTDFIRAQLSSDELVFLFYYGLSERGAKFKDLVEKYNFFKDVPSGVLIDEEHKELYATSVYEKSG